VDYIPSAMPHPPSILPDPYRPPTREQIERARQMYAEKFTVSRILAACDMSLGTLYYWLGGGPRENGGPLYPPIPRRRQVLGRRRAPLPADRVSLAARLWRTAERQARDIEERLARPAAATPERERDVRMLAMLVRSLRDLSLFEAAGPAGEGAGARAPGQDAEHDPIPEDIDAFRFELARRIRGFIAARDAERAEAQMQTPTDQGGAIEKS